MADASVIQEIFEDYHITADVCSHHVGFRVAKILFWSDGEPSVPAMYGDTFDEGDCSAIPADAPAFWTGSVKWDGCSNWDFGTSECMAHFCGRKQATSIGRLMDRLYAIAKDALHEVWDGGD